MDNKYYSLQKLLSYNAIVNAVIGERSAGKTYAFKEWCIKSFLKDGAQFVYLRRFKTEIETKESLFDDIKDKYNIDVKMKGKRVFISENPPVDEDGNFEFKPVWKEFGFIFTLGQAQEMKSTPMPKVDKIGFDEFIIEDLRKKYIPREFDMLMSIYSTVDRSRNVTRLIMMSNSAYLDNPYFTAYGIRKKDFDNKEFVKKENGDVVFQYYKPDEHILTGSHTERIGKSYGDYAIRNQFKDGGNEFLTPKKPDKFAYYLTLTNGDEQLYLYVSTNKSTYDKTIWVTKKAPKKAKQSMMSVISDRPIIDAPYNTSYISTLKRKTHQLLVMYETHEARNLWYEMLKP